MALKKVWQAVLGTPPERSMRHRFEGNKMVASSHQVWMSVRVSEGSQEGREVGVWLTAKQADTLSQRLTLAAMMAKAQNLRDGLGESDA
jgi:hypothetical protein